MSRLLTHLFAPVLSVVLLTSLPLSLRAQNAPAVSLPPVKATGTPPAGKTISLELSDVLLPNALKMIFTNAGKEYAIGADVPDSRITMKIVNLPFETALAAVLRTGSSTGLRLSYTVEGGIYRIRAAPETSNATSIMRTVLSNVPVESVVAQLQYLSPEATILADPRSNGLVISGTKRDVDVIDYGIQMMDVIPKNLALKAEVVLVLAGKGKENRNPLLSTVMRSQAGQEAEGEDKISVTPTQLSKLVLRAKALPLGNGTYEVTTRWDVTLPLSANQVSANDKKPSRVLIEKRVTNITRFTPGQTNVVGSIVLNQYGLKGEILFFLTVEEVEEGKKK
jgi:type II secretory pathway component GspD/PulD (secretin)